MMFEEFGVDAPTSTGVAKGCKKCSGTGYAGRAPLFEIIMVDQTLRDLVRTGHAESYVTDKRETLFGHGLSLVSAGRTSFDEIMRVVQLDD
jgi:general secretion pathway protein E